MPLGQRELLLMVRARDLASGTFRQIGAGMRQMGTDTSRAAGQMLGASAALTTVGTTLGLAGAAGLAFMNDATNAAIDYRQQVGLTLTQVENQAASFEQLRDLGLQVARDIPVPFEAIQLSLYDIFSSIDVNLNEAEVLLRNFAKAAVAGQTDIQQAGRATIAILNAFGLPIEEIDRIMDVQFQTVRKGVMTYDEFANTIGQVIPAATRAGQEVETMGGVMAFLTRNGLSAEMAATSAARAFELMAMPKVVERLESMGVAARDGSGNFRQINDVVSELGQKLQGLPKPEQVAILDELFRGQGNRIQARRFFDTAIVGFDELNQRVGEMHNASGALGDAYDIMFNQPQSQIDLLTNKYRAMQIELGEKLIPVKMKVVEWATRLLDWWNRLDEGTQSLIIKIVTIGSVLLVVVGGVLTLVGAIAGLIGVIMLAGASFGTAIAIIGGVTVIIPIIIGLVILLIKHWDTLKRWTLTAWNAIKEAVGAAIDFLVDLFQRVSSFVVSAWNTVTEVTSDAWQTFVETIVGAVTTVADTLVDWHNAVQDAVTGAIKWFRDLEVVEEIGSLISTAIESAGIVIDETLKTIGWVIDGFSSGATFAFDKIMIGLEFLVNLWQVQFNLMWEVVQFVWGMLEPLLTFWFETMQVVFSTGLDILMGLWNVAWEAIGLVVEIVLGTLNAAFSGFWEFTKGLFSTSMKFLTNLLETAWDFIRGVVEGALKVISGIVQFVMAAIRGDFDSAWEGIKRIFEGAWQIIMTGVNTAINTVKGTIEYVLGLIKAIWDGVWTAVKTFFTESWQGIIDSARGKATELLTFIWGLPNRIISALGNIGSLLWDAGVQLIRGMINGVKSMVGAIKDAVVDTLSSAVDAGKSFLGLSSPSKLFRRFGEWTGEGYVIGLQNMYRDVAKASEGMMTVGAKQAQLTASMNQHTPVGQYGAGQSIQVTFADGAIRVEGVSDPEEAAEKVSEKFEDVIREVMSGS